MYPAIVVLFVAATGCGFGFGAVDGASRTYAVYGQGDFYKDSSGTHVDSSGQRWRRGMGPFLGNATPGVGVLLGFRRGITWHRYNDQAVDTGRTADYHLTGYWGALSLGLGYTNESGRTEIMSGTTPLPADIGYSGWYLEPAYALFANGPLYLGATFAYIDGETAVKLDIRNSSGYAEARGLRPGLRFAIGLLPVGPVTLKLSADVRYLITPEVAGAGTYGGVSTAFSLSFVL